MVEAPLLHQGKRTFRQFALYDDAIFYGNQRLVPLVFHVHMRRRVIRELHAHMDTEEAGNDRHGLHVPAVLATYLIQRMRNLPQRVVLHRLDQLLEHVAPIARGGLQHFQAV